MKKKLISSVVCFALLVVMFIGSSIAWFTDTAASVNTMVAGKISIKQTENFEQESWMLPSDVIIKEVTVTNDGNQPAYVRTLFAFEDAEYTDEQGQDLTVLDMVITQCVDNLQITIPGVNAPGEKVQFTATLGTEVTTFTVGYLVHPAALAVGDVFSNLTAVTLDARADNAWQEAVNGKYDLIVLSQACQTIGLGDDPAVALDTAFAAVSAETGDKVALWFGYVLKHSDHYGETVEVAKK